MLDFAETPWLDTAGMAALLLLSQSAGQDKLEIQIINASRSLLRALRLNGLPVALGPEGATLREPPIVSA